jgi:hypothetical protein
MKKLKHIKLFESFSNINPKLKKELMQICIMYKNAVLNFNEYPSEYWGDGSILLDLAEETDDKSMKNLLYRVAQYTELDAEGSNEDIFDHIEETDCNWIAKFLGLTPLSYEEDWTDEEEQMWIIPVEENEVEKKESEPIEDQSLTGSRKILITISSANGSNPEKWSLGFAGKYDVTNLCKEIGQKTNQEYTKIIAGLEDKNKFNKDYNNYLKDFSDTEVRKIARMLDKIMYGGESISELKILDKKFEKLDPIHKYSYIEKIKDADFLIVRNSYIYKVVDESEYQEDINYLVEYINLL